MNEIDVLHDVFGPDEIPSAAAHDRARATLLGRLSEGPANAAPPRHRRPRWAPRISAAVAVAAAVAVGVVVVTSDGTHVPRDRPSDESRPAAAAPPFARPAGAVEFLENAAWTAAHRPWVTPRPDQYMYVETVSTMNKREILEASPNGPYVPGQTELVRTEMWMRMDSQEMGLRRNGGEIDVQVQNQHQRWGDVPYFDLRGLNTPEKVDAWYHADKPVFAEPDALLMRTVLPPDVEAAIFRWLARQPGVKIDPDSVNLDGRPAIALTFHLAGYLQHDLLFDPQTYKLIGDREIAVADHTSVGDDGTSYIKAGDVFRLQVRKRTGIVDDIGETV